MVTLTLKGIDDSLAAALKKASEKSHTTIDKTAIRILKQALFPEKEQKPINEEPELQTDTWTDDEFAQFQDTIANFEKMDMNSRK